MIERLKIVGWRENGVSNFGMGRRIFSSFVHEIMKREINVARDPGEGYGRIGRMEGLDREEDTLDEGVS